MLKSPEEYLSGLNFDPPEPHAGETGLDAGERAFVEKYLGFDIADSMPVLEPEPVPLPALAPEPALQPVLAPEIVVAPPRIEIQARPVETAAPEIIVAQSPDIAPEELAVATEIGIARAEEADAVDLTVATDAPPIAAAAKTEAPVAAFAETEAPVAVAAEIETPVATIAEAQVAVVDTPDATVAPEVAAQIAPAPVAEELSLRDRMRQADEIQVVSFLISGQIFLLPVAGIQEVLRHMELVKVPQAPAFIAGAINLRGTVMPLVHLSALLTNSETWIYDEKSFIIVTGSTSFQMGLIIDKVNSMHMIPQNKIIWNVESKLGEAGEFLSALVDLDDKVCGMIAPDTITQRILSEF